MKKVILFSIIVLNILGACKKRADVSSSSEIKNYSQLLERYMREHGEFSGCVLVMQKGNVLLKKGYGRADREKNVLNTPETKFSIASLSKQFTAICILQLVEAGKLSLNDKLSKFSPDFPRADEVTIHMLLNHTSGIGRESTIDHKFNSQTLSKEDIIELIKTSGYEFDPGTNFLYSNSAYALLGWIIEQQSGMSYEQYLKENIFDKLGMYNSGVSVLKNLTFGAKGYDDQVDEKSISMSRQWEFSKGGIYSTVDDLYKLDRALYRNTILKDNSTQKMFTPGKGNYGYGVEVDHFANRYFVGHSGRNPGFTANVWSFVKDDIYILVLSNTISDVVGITKDLASLLFDMPTKHVYNLKEVSINPSLLDRYADLQYTSTKLGPFSLIKKDNNKLYVRLANNTEFELKPLSETKFFVVADKTQGIEFEVSATGKVIRAWSCTKGERVEELKETIN